jgi:hypothetical protein
MRISIVLIFALLLSCDSASNLELPEDNYFLKYFGNDGNQQGIDLDVDSDGNIYLLGISDSLGSPDFRERQLMLVKTDAKGSLIWQKTFGTPKIDNARDLLITTDNQLVVLANTAASFSTGNIDSDIYIAIFDKNGVLLSTKTFGFENATNEIGYSISQTTDGFIVAGSTTFVDPKNGSLSILESDITDGLLVRFYSDLSLYPSVWRQRRGTEFSDAVVSVIPNENGDFSLFGYSNAKLTITSDLNYKYWVRRLNFVGEARGEDLFIQRTVDNQPNAGSLVLNAVVKVSDGFLLAGQYNNGEKSNIYVSKVSNSLTLISSSSIENFALGTSLPTLSNPTSELAAANTPNGELYVLANQLATVDNSNWLLDKLSRSGSSDWTNPVLFGGEYEDKIGAIKVLKDGKILMIGTIAIGARGSEKKLTLIKVNSSGKFAK